MSVTFTNENQGSGIQLGSDNLNVPSGSGFSVINALTPGSVQKCPIPLPQQGKPCFYVFDSSGNPVTTDGGTGPTLALRNLNLAPGATIAISFLVTTPTLPPPPQPPTVCTTSSPCLWTDQSRQSNDFSGTGNGLNPDPASAYGTITSAVASLPRKQGGSTMLADGGTGTGNPGTVSVTINTTSGKTAVTQIQTLDFGPPPDPSKCVVANGQQVVSAHYTYWDMFNTAGDNGADRSQSVSITTTTANYPGVFEQELCFVSHKQFMMKAFVNGQAVLQPANSIGTFPDGSPGPAYEGLLPDCASNPMAIAPTVDCSKLPGVQQRLQDTVNGTATTVGTIAPGFDRAIIGN
jgi:hypothetical protein